VSDLNYQYHYLVKKDRMVNKLEPHKLFLPAANRAAKFNKFSDSHF